MVAGIGAILGICLTGFTCGLTFGRDPHLPFIVAPMGASAVLLFAVPASPLAQPWSIIGGNTISALVGISVGRLVHEPMAATGIAVGLAIVAMSMTRCLHPPGGAAALTAIIGGPSVTAAGFTFALVPVCLNAILLVFLGIVFHKFSPHSYPHVPAVGHANTTHTTADLAPQDRVGAHASDIDATLDDLVETFDLEKEDLDGLLLHAESRALSRSLTDLSCGDVMSRAIVSIDSGTSPQTAHSLLLHHGVCTLPITDPFGRLIGTVGLRELSRHTGHVSDVMTAASGSKPEAPLFSLIATLTDGKTNAVVIVDESGCILGLVTQTDVLRSISRSLGFLESLADSQ
jgi:CBS domain-containing membrane protein